MLLAIAWITSASVAVTTVAGLLVLLSDRALLAWRLRNGQSAVELTMSITATGEGGVPLAGGMIHVEAELRAPRAARHVLVTPLVPASFEPVGGAAYSGLIAGGEGLRLAWTYRVPRRGMFTIPGLIMRTVSPLRAFSSPQLVVDRGTITVLPNYRGEGHRVVARQMISLRRAEITRRHVLRGFGTDFHELREYVPGDPRKRVDWKATARRHRLMVREFEEPLEYSIQVVLDASLNMTHHRAGVGAFDNAATFIARLAFVAMSQRIALRLWTYDCLSVRMIRRDRGIPGYTRLMAEIASLPRIAMQRGLERTEAATLKRMCRLTWARAARRYGAAASAATLESFLAAYRPGAGSTQACRDFVIDFNPRLAFEVPMQCADCGDPMFPDEGTCPWCGTTVSTSGLSALGAAATESLMGAIKRSRGREMLVFVSALEGGEINQPVETALCQAASGHRTVHVALPAMRSLDDARPVSPGFLGARATRMEVLRNLGRLERTTRFRLFRERLREAGITVHSLDDPADLDTAIESLLLSEVLAA